MLFGTRTTAAVILAAALILPAAANAAQPADRTLVLQSHLTQALRGGEIDGTMRLTLTPEGIISGTYQNADTGQISNITGGVDPGNKLWLEVGGLGHYHFTGTLTGTTIDATAYHGNDDLRLLARP